MTMVVGVGGGAGNSFYLFASCRIWYDDVLQVVRQPKSDRSNEMTLRTMHELCLNMSIAIGADTITCNLASVIDGRTRGSVYGSSVGDHVMGGVCSIDLQCCGVILPTCAQLGRGPECHELTFGAQGSSMCPGVIGSGMHSA